MATGRLEIAPERFAAWLERFVAEHDGASVATVDTPEGPVTTVRWPDGQALCTSFVHDPVGLILVRRGGYAVGLASGGRLLVSKVGRRHVQGRTAAGGWSQQRFARRRQGQAAVLVDAVADHAAHLLLPGLSTHPARPATPGAASGIPEAPQALVLGGDRSLAAAVLADRRLSALAGLPRRELPDLPDPDYRVLAQAAQRGRAVWVRISAP